MTKRDAYDVELIIIEVLEKQFRCDGQTMDAATNFREDLGFGDSDWIDLIAHIEQLFDLAIPEMEAAKMVKIGDVANHISSRFL